MNKKLLCAALVGGLSLAQAASAQEFDDRWYVTGSVGYNVQDNDRNTENVPFITLGVGKWISPDWTIDGELNYQNAHTVKNVDLEWHQYGISFDARRHFRMGDNNWWPYLVMGLGYQKAEEHYEINSPNSPATREDGNLAAKAGFGLQGDTGRVNVRAELAYRIDFDDNAVAPSYDGSIDDADSFGDLLASIGVVIPLGPEPVAPVAPPPPAAPSCADLDDDGDGVNNCNDKCPGSQAGQTIGPDGCPVPVSIDLRGVNFDFDEATLRPDAVAILNEAIEILSRYPELTVEVAGHTDLCGSDTYNQELSADRAQAVYDYLTSNGIAATRLVGPIGYGESRPLEMTPQTFPACKLELNRRTELNVQN